MKILYVIDSLGTGGAERSTSDLWYFLSERGVQVKLVVLNRRKEGIQKEILEKGFDVHFLNRRHFFYQCMEIASEITKFRPDIVHSVLFKSNLRCRIAKVVTNFRYVESLVNCSYDKVRLRDPNISKPAFYFYKFVDFLTSKKVDSYAAITEEVKNHYTKELKISRNKIAVILRGRRENAFIDQRLSLRSDFLKRNQLSDNTVMIIHVGRQEFQKGHMILLKAVKALESRINRPVVFVFAGRAGNSTAEIEALTNGLHFSIPILWLGHRYDIPQLLAMADIFVFPSLYEGLGGVLIEAQAAKLPIVCSDLPVLHEVVKKDNARMFQTGNDLDLADKLLSVINDDILRREMGNKSLENFRAKFSLDKVNNEMLDFYNKLL